MGLHDYTLRPAHIKWLLDSDPAVRWQVMRDLTDQHPGTIAVERSRIATAGWGVQTSLPPICRWPLGRAAGGPRLARYALQSGRLDGPRPRPGQPAGPQNDRPHRQAPRLQTAQQPSISSR